MLIRAIEPQDASQWERMRQALWPSPAGEHAAEIARFLSGDRRNPLDVFLAFDEQGRAMGFAEVSIRSDAAGCYDSGRVAYLEGWYVEPDHRRQGVGAALVKAVENWGRSHHCTDLASDAELDNDISAIAHQALGFEEVERVVCFRKDL